ncbi:hypothetical protein SKAU_G00412170 [Synaphobranchus kaupii]|uniref:Uncharacterized protein n=1 Tax=Synaphobranchus kaupii TaxID=118154 RepID=A0A9Q1I9W7_SYNKA|nr:hypothetical protein SKAU_G00412170 [Synaphobranchus kaupii]
MRRWMDLSSKVPWRSIEAGLANPIRLQDLPFSCTGHRTKFRPIIVNTLKVWKTVEKLKVEVFPEGVWSSVELPTPAPPHVGLGRAYPDISWWCL